MADQPKWRSIARDLCRQIERGQIPIGHAVPSLSQLCTLYGVSDRTVRHAIDWFKSRGILAGVNGVGVFVQRRPTAEDLDSMNDPGPALQRLAAKVDQLEQSMSNFHQEMTALGQSFDRFQSQVTESVTRYVKGHTDG